MYATSKAWRKLWYELEQYPDTIVFVVLRKRVMCSALMMISAFNPMPRKMP